MNKISWFYNRLKAMSMQEVLYRIKKVAKHKYYRKKYERDIYIYDIYGQEISIDILNKNLEEVFKAVELDTIDEDMSYKVFNEVVNLEEDIQWHKGMYGQWNSSVSSYDIEFKNTDDIGDIRYSWEINRHQFMPYIACKYLKTKDEKYLDILEEKFENWVEGNCFLKGINWSSAMEIALRAYQWLIVVYLIKDTDRKDFKQKLSKGICASTEYVMNNLSLYSSANNHLILEAAISSIIGLCFDGVVDQNWFSEGYSILKEEIPKQFHEDGVNKEQALHYQGFVTDMMLQYNSIMRSLGKLPLSENLIKKSVIFMAELNSSINYSDFGDSDDAKIVALGSSKYNYYEYLLVFASEYYGESFIQCDNKYPEVQLFCNEQKDKKVVKLKGFSNYEKGGYSIIKNNNNLLVFDYGELGFGDLAAHGHADALMFIYQYGGKEFFTDSGTFIYNIKSDRRNYYRSTKAHNTLCFEGENQSEIKGPFLWGKKSKTKLNTIEDLQDKYVLEAENDGYSPKIHRRKIEYYKSNDLVKIFDYFDGNAEINFILDNKVFVEVVEKNIYKLKNDKELYIYLSGESQVEKTFISKKFLVEEETFKIEVKYNFRGNNHLTLICSDLEILKSEIEEGK